jgi:hypothetical protein
MVGPDSKPIDTFVETGPHHNAFPMEIGDDILHSQITAVDDYSQSAYDHWFHENGLLIV